MNVYQIIKRPIITEQTAILLDQSTYTFEVDKNANKHQIKEAIETIFKVTVVGVNTLRIHRKQRRRGRFEGYTALGKKAVVRLKEGDKIEIFEGA
jgi:large subunit ribosomal protein L23